MKMSSANIRVYLISSPSLFLYSEQVAEEDIFAVRSVLVELPHSYTRVSPTGRSRGIAASKRLMISFTKKRQRVNPTT